MRRIAGILIGLLLIAGAAQAQPAPWEPERVTAGWTLTPSMVFGALWDSNVTVRQQHDPHVQGWVGLLNPRGEIDFNGRRTHFNSGYSGALMQYRNLPELERYEQHARMEVRHQLRPHISLFTRASASVAPSTDRLDIAPGVVPFVMVGSRTFDATGGFSAALSPRTTLDGTYRFEDVHFQKNDVANPFLRGGHSNVGSATVMHQLSSRMGAGGAYEYRHASIAAGEQIFDVQTVTGEVAYQVNRSTAVSGGGGITFMNIPYRDLSMSGPTVHGTVQHTEGRTTVSVGAERGYNPSLAFAGLTQTTRATAGVHVPFGRGRYTTSARVGYGTMHPVSSFTDVGLSLKQFTFTGTLGYAVARWLRAEAFYTGVHQTSSARGLIERSRIGFQFVTSKPVRIE